MFNGHWVGYQSPGPFVCLVLIQQVLEICSHRACKELPGCPCQDSQDSCHLAICEQPDILLLAIQKVHMNINLLWNSPTWIELIIKLRAEFMIPQAHIKFM